MSAPLAFGYAGRVLHVDLSSGSTRVEPLEESLALSYIGGRGFNMRRLWELVPPSMGPESPDNPLMFGVGPLDGTLFPGASRFNVSGLSPHTGILGDSNAGGFFGPELKYAGFDQVIITGRSPTPVYLVVRDGAAELRPASHLWGKDIPETDRLVRQELGDDRAQVAVAGPAAEHGVTMAGIFVNLVRAAARTGMGALMASKNLKAVAVRGTQPVQVKEPERFSALITQLNEEICAHSDYQPRGWLGTTRLVGALNRYGALATRHYKQGTFESASEVSGETLARKHKVKSKACHSCPIPCSRYFKIQEGEYKGLGSEGPEFEGLAGFTSRVGNSNLELGLHAVDLCNRYGMDVIGVSECVSFAMECRERGILTSEDLDGLDMAWGSPRSILEMIRKIAYREGVGDLFALGIKKAAERIGRGSSELAMHVKGLEFFQADPRGLKGYALGLAVASRGGDHLRSEPSFEFTGNPAEAVRRYGAEGAADRLSCEGKGRLVKHFEELCALSDSLNACKNTIVNMEVLPFDRAADLLRAATGLPFDEASVQDACERTVNLERAFIVLRGIRRADDTLPRRFLEEPLKDGASAGSVVELDHMLDDYYDARGWDRDTGIPTRQTLLRLRLDDAAEALTGLK
ncbi:MAG: aldehyde ferredoxin oxidoreductase family protein [Bacillota bacterium]